MLLAGCDLTGEYDKKFQEALKTTGLRAKFDQLLRGDEIQVTDVAGQGVGVTLKLPGSVDNNKVKLTDKDARAQPPFVKLPGLSATYERQLDDSGGQFLPVYVYLAAVPKAEQKADALQSSIAQQVAALAAGTSWSDQSLTSPTGAAVALKRLRFEGQQEFMNIPQNKPMKVDGRFDLYYIDAPSHHVLIGWRAPKGQAEKYQFYDAAEAAMAAVTLGQAASPAASAEPAPAAPPPAAKTGCF